MSDVILRYCIGCNAMNWTEEVNNTKGDLVGTYAVQLPVRSQSRVSRVVVIRVLVVYYLFDRHSGPNVQKK